MSESFQYKIFLHFWKRSLIANQASFLVVASVTVLGYILKVLATNILSKLAKIFNDFLGYLEKALFR